MRKKFVLIIALLLMAIVPLPSQTDSEPQAQLQMQVLNTSLLDYSSSKVVLGLTLAVTSSRDVTLEQISLAGVRLNGLPLYAAPLKRRMDLHASGSTTLPEPLPVTIYLRDLDTVAPLRDAIANGHATVDGTAYATVHLNPLVKVLLLSKKVDVAINLHQDVPVTIPGGRLTKSAALAVLQAADTAMHAIGSTVTSGLNWASTFRHNLVRDYAPHVLLSCARFEVQGHDGETTSSEWCGVALALAGNRLVLPKEAIKPWEFDPDMSEAVKSKKLVVTKGSYDLWVWPASASVLTATHELNKDTAFRLSQQQLAVLTLPDDDKRKIRTVEDSGKTNKTSIQKRESSSDLALLEIRQPLANLSALKTADELSETASWDTVALFRFRGGSHSSTADPELILMPAKRDGTRIILAEPVDSSAFGSPIVGPEGVVGIVQDENSGVIWPEAARVLKLNKQESAQK